ncbi:hypothetical protein Celaphus_00011519 [Cervus elaphus hippelaphus]|uniref:Uncharacterized protein n=1 Tax=Cervus elaphus hippelaphus TaxID=46360 RepID=A0A212DEY0_CEREH|nr:hypothetical protein Celaphus_00011519 [Cervus elaphus hippelaphus]
MWQKCHIKQFHIWVSPGLVSQSRPGTQLGRLVTQRKEEQEPPEESAELVHKKSNESFPGTLRSQKDRDNPSPIPCLSQ